MGNYLSRKYKEMEAEKTLITTMSNELKDAIGEGDKDKIKKVIDRFLPPGANFDDTKVKRQRMYAFKQALTMDDFPMVEMLYDHWCGDLHWFGHDINQLRTLGKLLEDARVVFLFFVCNVKNQQLLIDIESLITFNAFQETLYSSITKTSPVDEAWKPSMLVEVLRIYDEYSDLEKVRIPHESVKVERKLQALFKDSSSEYMKGQGYLKYEVYFRKLDFNVALLILENLYVLRRHLRERFNKPLEYYKQYPGVKSNYENEVLLYKEIECALYHFIYRTFEDWRLYLPRNRKVTTEEHHTGIDNLKITYDEHKLFNGPVLFLERKSFKDSLKKLKVLLEKHVISNDPAIVWMQKQTTGGQGCKRNKKITILLNDNYLTPTMYMSDYYSLSKIVYYIEAIENTNNIHFLMIERVLQVTGEMSKSTPATYHISKSTKSLLQIAISMETIKNLHDIRTFLSKADEGQISARIAIANQVQIFDDIKQDLIIIKERINLVLDIYKFIFDKSLLEKGLCLLDERTESFPDSAKRQIDEIYRCYEKHGDKLFEEFGELHQELKAYTGLETQLLKEITWIRGNKDDILLKIQSAKTTIHKNVACILPTYIRNVRQMLNENHNNVNWESIEETLSFFIKDCELFEPGAPIHQISFKKDLPTVTNILKELQDKCKSTSTCGNSRDSFDGIEKLYNTLKVLKETNLGDSSETVREKSIFYLISRVNLLKDTLQYPQHRPLAGITLSDQHLRRYKHNKEFRFVLEMILADIGNVLDKYEIKGLMIKSGRSLREIDLGNVLDHGNPFLEVIGDFFDSYDLSSSLLSKANMFAKDGESIEALFELFKDKDIDYEIIKKEKLEKMNDNQKKLYDVFQRSPNWESYADLIPKRLGSN